MKNKKIIIGIIAIIVIVAVIVAAVILVQKNDQKQAEQALNDYINLINEKDYEGMYQKVASMNMSKEDYITRNQNIYEGIDSSNIKISISDTAKNDNGYQISYRQQMYTSAGEVDFYNVANMVKEKENTNYNGHQEQSSHNLKKQIK